MSGLFSTSCRSACVAGPSWSEAAFAATPQRRNKSAIERRYKTIRFIGGLRFACSRVLPYARLNPSARYRRELKCGTGGEWWAEEIWSDLPDRHRPLPEFPSAGDDLG